MEIRTDWILCPARGRKTHNKNREDTETKNLPLEWRRKRSGCGADDGFS
ncbi:MAG: hypothetical protein KHX22_05595 [Clostridiales bacterium]|nr:hypothetical protein [Clostridiales bacterium]PWM23631.1 MAG: hypothetical protein DBX53_01125 [Clostridiales bacterium]